MHFFRQRLIIVHGSGEEVFAVVICAMLTLLMNKPASSHFSSEYKLDKKMLDLLYKDIFQNGMYVFFHWVI